MAVRRLTMAEWQERCRQQDLAYEEEQARLRALAVEMGEEYEETWPLTEEEEAIEALTTESRVYNSFYI